MKRSLSVSAVLLAVLVGGLAAQEGIQRGRLKKLDADKKTVTITVGDKDETFTLTPRTRVMDAAGKEATPPLADRGFVAGARVAFKAEERDGRAVLVGLKLLGDGEGPGGEIRRGTVKKINPEKKTITLSVGGKEQVFQLTDGTQVLGASGADLKERLRGIKEGSEVFFKAGRTDGKDVIYGLKPMGVEPKREPPPKIDLSQFKPLTELGPGEYQGFTGGLYPGGKNERPAAHEAAGLRQAKQVRPLDADGKPSPDGKIVLLSVGMSNTSQASEGFRQLLVKSPGRNPRLVFVNGAQGGMTAFAIQDPNDKGRGTQYWDTVDQRLKAAGVSRAQVQVVWIKQADAGPNQGFPKYARTLEAELAKVVRVIAERFPNAKIVYLSSRTYGGYAKSRLNPEPYAYESGFAVKWLIEKQIKGDPALNYDPAKGPVKAPWLSWGPYLWANGSTKRSDGFFYEEKDFAADGTHESPSGQAKVGRLLFEFFKTDETAWPWFLAP